MFYCEILSQRQRDRFRGGETCSKAGRKVQRQRDGFRGRETGSEAERQVQRRRDMFKGRETDREAEWWRLREDYSDNNSEIKYRTGSYTEEINIRDRMMHVET